MSDSLLYQMAAATVICLLIFGMMYQGGRR